MHVRKGHDATSRPGAVLCRQRFRRKRRLWNLYHAVYDDALLARSVGDTIQSLGLSAAPPRATARYVLASGLWKVVAIVFSLVTIVVPWTGLAFLLRRIFH